MNVIAQLVSMDTTVVYHAQQISMEEIAQNGMNENVFSLYQHLKLKRQESMICSHLSNGCDLNQIFKLAV